MSSSASTCRSTATTTTPTRTNTLLVGDDVDDLVLIDISKEPATLEVLCNHKTSWHTQTAHCHPTWSWDGSRILYASDFGGKVNLYMIWPSER